MKKKVFCQDCEYYRYIDDPSLMVGPDSYCDHPSNLKDTAIMAAGVHKLEPTVKNRGNNCRYFSKGLSIRVIEKSKGLFSIISRIWNRKRDDLP